jgi:hypothetical protein
MRSIPPLHSWPAAFKKLILVFTSIAFFGVVIGGVFIEATTNLSPRGVVEQYSGNEQNRAATAELKFAKPFKEMLTTTHNHILGLSPLFLIIGLLYLATGPVSSWRMLIAAEPFLSLILTFGGLWVMRYWWAPFVYVVIASGTAMLLCFGWMSLVIMKECLKKDPTL